MRILDKKTSMYDLEGFEAEWNDPSTSAVAAATDKAAAVATAAVVTNTA